MRTLTCIALLLLLAPACNDDCPSATATAGFLGCCDSPPADDLCVTHPFGRAIECGPEERPQLAEKCEYILNQNPDLCSGDYVACRDALRVADCDVCPVECAGIAGACDDVDEGGVVYTPKPIKLPGANVRDCLRLDEVFTGAGGAVIVSYQWIDVTNVCATEIDLKDVYAQYTRPVYEWAGGFVPLYKLGKLGPGECATVGGPLSSDLNGNPPGFDLVEPIDPLILPGLGIAEGVGLFVKGDAAPFDAVIYGGPNTRGLVDETGTPGAVDLPIAGRLQSMQRGGAIGWSLGTPKPGTCG